MAINAPESKYRYEIHNTYYIIESSSFIILLNPAYNYNILLNPAAELVLSTTG